MSLKRKVSKFISIILFNLTIKTLQITLYSVKKNIYWCNGYKLFVLSKERSNTRIVDINSRINQHLAFRINFAFVPQYFKKESQSWQKVSKNQKQKDVFKMRECKLGLFLHLFVDIGIRLMIADVFVIDNLGSISSTFYIQLLRSQIPKA